MEVSWGIRGEMIFGKGVAVMEGGVVVNCKAQRRMVRSEEALKRMTGSESLSKPFSGADCRCARVVGSRASASTPIEWPFRVCSFLPLVAFQMMMLASEEPVMRISKGKEGSRRLRTHLTKSVWPLNRVLEARVSTSQDQTVLSQQPP